MGPRSDDRPEPTAGIEASADGDGEREGQAGDDWEDRHARTTEKADRSDAPTVRITSLPPDCDWHVRHSHVRKVADR